MRRILIIDDEEPVRTLLRLALVDGGYDVAEEANADSAVASYEARPADLIITDIIMPEEDSPAKILELVCKHPGIQLIAMSGAANQETAIAVAKLLGARQLLQKPFSMQELLEAVRTNLDPVG